MFKVQNQFRIRKGGMSTTDDRGNNGAFLLPHYRISNYEFFCIASDGMGWEHVSVTVRPKDTNATRCPTWSEMCWIKAQFWGPDDCVVQFHPPAKDYVNNHEFCLHLWSSTQRAFPQPDSIMVGTKS